MGEVEISILRIGETLYHETNHCIRWRNRRTHLSSHSCGTGSPTSLWHRRRDSLCRCRRENGDGKGPRTRISHHRTTHRRTTAQIYLIESKTSIQTTQERTSRQADCPLLQSRYCRRFWRLCIRAYSLGCTTAWRTYTHSGAKLLCRTDQ